MVYRERETNNVSREEVITSERLEEFKSMFDIVAKEMSEVLGKPITVELGVQELPAGVFKDKRFVVTFYKKINGKKENVAWIDWKLQDFEYPDTMEDGWLGVKEELRGHDFGYKMFKIKRQIGEQMGYKKILMHSLDSEGYPDNIVARTEEKKYEWKYLTDAENPYVGATTYLGNILPKQNK
jgi:hypothetical protein